MNHNYKIIQVIKEAYYTENVVIPEVLLINLGTEY